MAAGGKARRFQVPRHLPDWALAAGVVIFVGWIFGANGAALAALALAPVVIAARIEAAHRAGAGQRRRFARVGAPLDVELALAAAAQDADRTGRETACIVLAFDDRVALAERLGPLAMSRVEQTAIQRCTGALRDGDVVALLPSGRIAVALAPEDKLGHERVAAVATRLQAAVAQPFSIDAGSVHASVSAGFCLAGRAPTRSAAAVLTAAAAATDAALRAGPGGLRAFAPGSAVSEPAMPSGSQLAERVATALDRGEIVGWFQPQLCTDTGQVAGFEVLARWICPERGVVPPADFLPAIEAGGLSERLTEVMMHAALSAHRAWDRAGLPVPAVSVNFSGQDLRNPRLVEKLRWELDRFAVDPSRFTVEILETVVADVQDDAIVQNVAALARLGTGIDLDDFGTGHASIANMRRFAVRRIKIDRSFVTGIDRDRDQQRMLAAILAMAERMGLETLAEGVETHGEHAMLAQLGCTHVQGFGIARPMPFDETLAWMERHAAKLALPPPIGRKAG